MKITKTSIEYAKNGTKWEETNRDIEEVSQAFYNKFIAVRFSDERREKNYTPLGFVPVKVSTTSPSKQLKHVTSFKFELQKGSF